MTGSNLYDSCAVNESVGHFLTRYIAMLRGNDFTAQFGYCSTFHKENDIMNVTSVKAVSEYLMGTLRTVTNLRLLLYINGCLSSPVSSSGCKSDEILPLIYMSRTVVANNDWRSRKCHICNSRDSTAKTQQLAVTADVGYMETFDEL